MKSASSTDGTAWKGIAMFAFVAFLWFGSIYLSARHGIHWPWIVLICFTFAGAAKLDVEEDSYLP